MGGVGGDDGIASTGGEAESLSGSGSATISLIRLLESAETMSGALRSSPEPMNATRKCQTQYLVAVVALVFVSACDRPVSPRLAQPVPAPTIRSEAPTSVSGGDKVSASLFDAEQKNREVAVLAGGCFWGMEDILGEVPGVLETEVGYTGGGVKSPRYEDVKTGTSGHAESVRIVFDRCKLSFAKLLEDTFFRMHDPTTRDRQGNDVGAQYRSAIFATTEEQKKVAAEVISKVNSRGQWNSPIVTEVLSAGEFTPAEDYHQDYLEKNPDGYTCHYMRDSVY